MQTGKLKLGARGDAFYINGLTQLVATDIPANNGVIHAIDSVLLPPAVLSTLTVTQVVSAYPSLSTLLGAVAKADLATTLSADPATYTVFAPDNAAFGVLLTALGITNGLDGLTAAQLAPILLYHVSPARYDAAAATGAAGGAKLSAVGGKYAITAVSGALKIDANATIVYTDINTKNGVIHVIDRVLLPSLFDIASTDARFTNLAAALTKADTADPAPALATALDNDSAALTLFAPVNSGFAALAPALGSTDAADLVGDTAPATLAAILKEHVVGTKEAAADVVAASSFDTLAGAATLKVGSRNGVRLNGFTSVTGTDILASNGYLHTLDSVLLPAATRADVKVSKLTVAYPNFSTLGAALQKAGLSDAVDTVSTTVFAPDNAAFADLLSTLGITNGLLGLSADQLKPILRYHVANETKTLAVLLGDGDVPGLGGTLAFTGVATNAVIDGNVNVYAADIIANKDSNDPPNNALVHLVTKILLPSITDIVTTEPELSQLASLVNSSPETEDVGAALDNNDSVFTLFAPNNDSIVSYLDATDPDPSGQALANVLLYHALMEPAVYASAAAALNNVSVNTALQIAMVPLTLRINPNGAVNPPVVRGGGNSADLSVTVANNLYARNGVIHIISGSGANGILLPPND